MTTIIKRRGVSSMGEAPPLCSRGDGKPVHSGGLCQACYRRKRRNGQVEPLAPEQRRKPGPAPDPSRPKSRYREPKPLVQREPKTHCPQGHPYDAENTYVDKNGYKHCRTCARELMQDRREPGLGQGGFNKAKTHCPQGHEYTPENTVRSKDGKRRGCRTCAKANNAVQVVKKYGITVEQFDALMLVQGSACAICHEPFVGRKYDIDHDHSCCAGAKACGKCVRGILCPECNRGLARFRDDPTLLQAALDYLGRSRYDLALTPSDGDN